ncbi:MAG: ABC transporter substrate-binding protein [Candidatus Acidiferrales bacterium]
MKRRAFQFLAVASIGCCALTLHSARRPRYGGTLRAEVGTSLLSIDPAFPMDTADQINVRERLLALVCDRLVTLDEHAQPRPALAISWQAAPGNKLWSLRLRSNVMAQDGAPFTAGDIVPVLEAANPRWRIAAATNPDESTTLNIEVPVADPSLPVELAMPRNFVFRRSANGTLVGTGPFQVSGWQAGREAVFRAFDAAWQGRPFVDSIELKMGRPVRDRLIDLETGKADFVDVPPDEARRAADRGARIRASLPDELLSLEFARGPHAAEDPAFRHALALSIDRDALVKFVLQRQGEAACSPLPQWSSGTAFLFAAAPDPAQTKQLAAQFQNAPALLLGYDGANALEKAVAERIAVNARDAGIRVNLQADSGVGITLDARLVRRKMISPVPRIALMELLREWAPLGGAEVAPLTDPLAPEDLYARERAAIENDRVIPLVYLPETFGLSARMRDWKSPLPASGDGWPFAQVWLEGEGR